MKWTECAITDLKKYRAMSESLTNIPERIRALESRFKSIKSGSSDSTPVQGGGNKAEGAIIDNIVERERLKWLYYADRRLVRLIERGLSALSQEERLVIDLFYIDRPKNYMEELMAQLGYEKTQIYRIKDAALYKFTVTMYGITEY